MLGAAIDAFVPPKVAAEAVGFVVETAIVACFTWHIAAGYVSGKYEAQHAAQAEADRTAEAHNRQLEADLAQAKQEASDALAHEQAHVAAVGDSFRAADDRMRGQLAAALGGRGAAQDSLAACQQRAAAAGDLLEQGLRLQVDLADSAESLAADSRAVRAWIGRPDVAAAMNAAGAASAP